MSIATIKEHLCDGQFGTAKRLLCNLLIKDSDGNPVTAHEAMILQAYAVTDTKLDQSNVENFMFLNSHLKTELSTSDLAKISVAITWLQRALDHALLHERDDLIYQTSVAFIRIAKSNVLNSKIYRDFMVTLADALETSTVGKDLFPLWRCAFHLILAYNLSKDSDIAPGNLTIFHNQLQIASNLASKHSNCRIIYMKLLSSILAFASHLVPDSFRNDRLSLLLQLKSSEKDVNALTEQFLSIYKESDNENGVFIDKVWIHYELLQLSFSQNNLSVGEILLDKLDSLGSVNKYYGIGRKMFREEFQIRTGLYEKKASNYLFSAFVRISQLIKTASSYNFQQIVTNGSTSLWNMLFPFLHNIPQETLLDICDDVCVALSKVKCSDIQQVRNSFEKELERQIQIASKPKKLVLENLTHEDRILKAQSLIVIAKSSTLAISANIFQTILNLYLQDYKYEECQARLYFTSASINLKQSLEEADLIFLLEFIRALYARVSSLSDMNSEDCKKVWDILFVTNLAFLTSVKQQTNVKLLDYNDHTEYEILTIQSDILLLGFLPNLDASYSLKLVELSLNNCIQLLHTSKRLHINWMIYNCGALFWKLFCLFHEKNPSELWAEGATKLYELFSELSMKNSSLFVLLSMAFATGQIEQYQATISKATATNSKLNKDMLNLFLKNAEESIKQAATIKESDLVSSMTIIPIWNKIHQLKGENKANLVIPLLEFDDPALKLLAASDAPATNNQPKSVPKDLESIETQFLAIHWLPNLPFVHKIKNYLKLAKQLTELSSQYVMAMGLYHKCFQFLAKASQIPNLNAIETSWCLILRIDLFNSYFGMMKTISKEYHAESITNLCTTFKKFGLNTSMMKDFFQAILNCFWNYQSVYLTVDNTYATFENMSKFLGQIYRFYQNCRAFKQMIDNSLTPTDYNIMTELYLAWGSACIDNDQQKIAIQINQMALAVLPLKLQGKLWARHCFLLQDSETNIQEILHPSFTLTWRDQLEIARAITTKNRKKEFLEAYRMMKMENLGDSQISEYCIEFFHEGFTDEELGIPKTALNIEEQPRLVFLEVHRISRRIKEALNVKELEVLFSSLHSCVYSLIIPLLKAASKVDKSSAVANGKPTKGKKGGNVDNPIPVEVVEAVPLENSEWETFIWSETSKSIFSSGVVPSVISVKMIERPLNLISDLVEVVKVCSAFCPEQDCFLILQFLELIVEHIVLENSMIYQSILLIHFFVLQKKDKKLLSLEKYKAFLALNVEMEYPITLPKLVGAELAIGIIMFAVDILLFVGDISRAIDITTQVIQQDCKKYYNSITQALVGMAQIYHTVGVYEKVLSFTKLALERTVHTEAFHYQAFLLQLVAKLQLNMTKGYVSNSALEQIDSMDIFSKLEAEPPSLIRNSLLEKWNELKYELLNSYSPHFPEIQEAILNIKDPVNQAMLASRYLALTTDVEGLQCNSKKVTKFIEKLEATLEPQSMGSLTVEILIYQTFNVLHQILFPEVNDDIENDPDIDVVAKYLRDTDPVVVHHVTPPPDPEILLTDMIDKLCSSNVAEIQKGKVEYCQAMRNTIKYRRLPEDAPEKQEYFTKATQSLEIAINSLLKLKDITILADSIECIIDMNAQTDPQKSFIYLLLRQSCLNFNFLEDGIRLLKPELIRLPIIDLAKTIFGINESSKYLTKKELFSKSLFEKFIHPSLIPIPDDHPKNVVYFSFVYSADNSHIYCGMYFKKHDTGKTQDKKKSGDENLQIEVFKENISEVEEENEDMLESLLHKFSNANMLKDSTTDPVEAPTGKGSKEPAQEDSSYHAVIFLDSKLEQLNFEQLITSTFSKVKSVARDFNIQLYLNRNASADTSTVETKKAEKAEKKEKKAKDNDKKKAELTPSIPAATEISILNTSFGHANVHQHQLDEAIEAFAAMVPQGKFRCLSCRNYSLEEFKDSLKSSLFTYVGETLSSDDFKSINSISTVAAIILNHGDSNGGMVGRKLAAVLTLLGVSGILVPGVSLSEADVTVYFQSIMKTDMSHGMSALSNGKLRLYGINVPCRLKEN